jgi:phenylalanyl-tRNA synthetase beta chain
VAIKGVTVKESPEWLQNKLRLIGLRPINNIVDITNYILHAYGQPLHCFDADKIKGGKIIVKTVKDGTKFVTLDEVEHTLTDRDLMICNAEEPMCIAGVFGGLDSGTTEQTTDVFLESAYFNPTWVRKTARRQGLSTDSSFRFERGIDPNGQIYALKEAALLVKELAGGTIASEIKDNYPAPMDDFRVELTYNKVHALIGKEIPHETIKSIVRSLEMKIVEETAEGLTLLVPPYRVDVQRDCDVIEDILRIYGYNNVEIPTTLKSSLTTKTDVDRSQKLQNIIGEQLAGCGFNEILNNSLTAAAYYEGLECLPVEHCVKLMNPLSNDLNVLRQSLLFGGLESINHNANRKSADLKFFEYGNVYFFDAARKNPEKTLAAYSEQYHLGLWVTGKRVSNSWAHPDEDSSVYELKAYVLNIFTRLGLNFGTVVFGQLSDDIFSSAITVNTRGGKQIAAFGIVTKKLQKKFDIDREVYYADINWDELMKAIKTSKVNFKELSKFPAVKRDLALLIDKKVTFAEIEKIAYESERKLLKEVSLFDVYEGKNLEAGKKSYAVSFLLQDETATLNDKQIDKIMQKIITNLQNKLEAKLR